ncbi:MAG: 2-oxo acid dehydrogenase subunit E2 [Chlamydiales bacterium]|nr:2-oxo acid dehydrogenase subunit E2 [Chlamydiales bacterium]
MTELFPVKMPKLGESIVSATITQWLKKEGDHVDADEPLLEVSTDKVNSEIPAPVSGTIAKIIAQEGSEYDVDAILCYIHSSQSSSSAPSQIKPLHSAPVQEEGVGMSEYYSPAVLRLAKEYKISFAELEKIKSSGAEGRLTKQDIEKYIQAKGNKQTASPCPHVAPSFSQDVERIQMSQMRKAIADNMVKSFYQAPHATLITEVDISRIMAFIKGNKEKFFIKYGYKLTITTFIAYAIGRAVQEYPFINSSIDKDTIVLKHYVNLGIAVSVDQAIMIPVIHRCEKKNIIEIAEAVSHLSIKARERTLTIADVSDGTITMTNFGMTGTKIGIPIIRYPEVAIVGVGAIEKTPVAIDDHTIGIRDCVHISLTFDHRALDGMYGCGFLESLKKHLENVELSFSL